MTFDPEKHHRRSIRLKGYDYASAGVYFVTICVQHRKWLFGEIVDGAMRLNDAGHMAQRWWLELPHKFPPVVLDEYIVMPNHFHGILGIFNAPVGADLRVCPDVDTRTKQGAHIGAPLRVCPDSDAGMQKGAPACAPLLSLGDVIQWFKTMTTNEYIRGVKQLGWPRFKGRLLQRNYYEHIIRDDESFHNIRNYIRANPLMWPYDIDNPDQSAADADSIRHTLAKHYGFTDEETDFVINYDMKYRMGRESQEEE